MTPQVMNWLLSMYLDLTPLKWFTRPRFGVRPCWYSVEFFKKPQDSRSMRERLTDRLAALFECESRSKTDASS